MGKFSFIILAATLSLFAILLEASQAQNAPAVRAPTIDLRSLRVAPVDEVTPNNVIDFENVQGPTLGAGIALTNQYQESHGISFGRGASVHFCARVTDDVNASLCAYPRAASGQRAAAHDTRAGGPAMIIDFARPVDTVSVRINPTGGITDEIFIAELTGFDANGNRLERDTLRFFWRQDAFTWPTTAAIETSDAGFSRVSIRLLRARQNNQPVRFLIDDLTLQYSPETPAAPVLSAIGTVRQPPEIASADVIQSEGDEDMREALRLYPAATRIRTAIDWDAVETTLQQQNNLGLQPAAHSSDAFLDVAELPLLLPSRADNGSLSIVSQGDTYHASFNIDGREYSLYGTRVLTLLSPSQGATAPAENVRAFVGEHELAASFSIYGASYTLTRYCLFDSVLEDPACHNRDEIGEIAREMVVAVGAAGRDRP